MLRPRLLPILGTDTVKIRTFLDSSAFRDSEVLVEPKSDADSCEGESGWLASVFSSIGGEGASNAGGV